MIICITGTPATGKTQLAKILKKRLRSYKYIDVKELIIKNKLYDSYDAEMKTFDVDTKKLNKFLIEKIIKKGKKQSIIKNKSSKKSNNLIIDSLLSHYLPKKYVDLCVITKCDLKELNSRLKKRRYSEQKIKDNLEAEIFDVCVAESKEQNHNIFVINTTKGIKKDALSQLVGEMHAIEQRS